MSNLPVQEPPAAPPSETGVPKPGLTTALLQFPRNLWRGSAHAFATAATTSHTGRTATTAAHAAAAKASTTHAAAGFVSARNSYTAILFQTGDGFWRPVSNGDHVTHAFSTGDFIL